jgi:hypothetical protein
MSAESGVDVGREGQQRQNPLLQGVERRKVVRGLVGSPNRGQSDLLEGFQETLCRRPPCPRLGLPRHEAVSGTSSTARLRRATLQKGQHPQRDGQQADQAGDPVVLLQMHRRQGQRPTLQASYTPVNGVLLPVCQRRLLQRKPLRPLIGDIDPPAQPTHGLLQRFLVHADFHQDFPFLPYGRRMVPIPPHRMLSDHLFALQAQQSLDLVRGNDRLGRLAHAGLIGKLLLPPAAFIQSRQSLLSLLQSSPHCGVCRPRLLQRAHDQLVFGP